MILLLITTTFSCCFLVTSSCKGTYNNTSKHRDLQIYNPQALSGALALLGHHRLGVTAQGLQVINSVDSCVLNSKLYR